MELKTDYSIYNDYDFVQKDGNLQELTVTITLCEYRGLISTLTNQIEDIKRLKAERKELDKTIEDLRQCLAAAKLPEWMSGIMQVFEGSHADNINTNGEGSEEGIEGEKIVNG